MGLPRLLAAVALLLALGAGAVAVVAWERGAAPSPADEPFAVGIVGPSNVTLFDGVVHVRNATALSALRDACEKGNLTIETQEYPGMGTYVRAIGGYRAHGGAGWIYDVLRGGAWIGGDRSAASYPLQKDDALRWRWTDG